MDLCVLNILYVIFWGCWRLGFIFQLAISSPLLFKDTQSCCVLFHLPLPFQSFLAIFPSLFKFVIPQWYCCFVQWEPWLTVSPLDRLTLTPVFSTQQSSNKSLSTQANTKMEAVASFFFFHLVQSFYLSKVSVKYGGIRMECSVYASFSGNQVYNHVGKWCFWSPDSGLKSRLKLKCNLS